MKRDSDFHTGKNKREITTGIFNACFEKHNTGLSFKRIQTYLKTMSTSEKVKNNELKNYITPSPFNQAMTLHYFLTKKNTLKKIPFIFLYIDKEQGDVYLKVPKEYKEAPDSYLKLLVALNYHMIIVNNERDKFSPPISLEIVSTWKHKMIDVPGNRNRLQFYGKVRGIVCLGLEEMTLLKFSILNNLIDLMK